MRESATVLLARTGEEMRELRKSLKQVDVARQYFESVYVQSELPHLSRVLLYVGVPAVAAPSPTRRDSGLEVRIPPLWPLGPRRDESPSVETK